MMQTRKFTPGKFPSNSLWKRMSIGGAIALLLMILFLLPIDDPNPEWGAFWFIRPLVVVTIAGAMGAAVYDILSSIPHQTTSQKIGITLFSLLVYLMALWLGTVLGLDGTLWN